MTRRFVLLHSSVTPPWREDLSSIRAALAEHGAECEFKDTAKMAQEEMGNWRDQVTACAMWRHQGVRQTFGSKKQGMLPYLGKQVPALLVYEDGKEIPVAVYPHRRRSGRTSEDYSITDYLRQLTSH